MYGRYSVPAIHICAYCVSHAAYSGGKNRGCVIWQQENAWEAVNSRLRPGARERAADRRESGSRGEAAVPAA